MFFLNVNAKLCKKIKEFTAIVIISSYKFSWLDDIAMTLKSVYIFETWRHERDLCYAFVIGKKLQDGFVELIDRKTGEKTDVALDDILDFVKKE